MIQLKYNYKLLTNTFEYERNTNHGRQYPRRTKKGSYKKYK
jgi:hypothetical protein